MEKLVNYVPTSSASLSQPAMPGKTGSDNPNLTDGDAGGNGAKKSKKSKS